MARTGIRHKGWYGKRGRAPTLAEGDGRDYNGRASELLSLGMVVGLMEELGARGESSLEVARRRWPCWIEVDLDAIQDNVRAIRGLLDPSCQVMAVVKAQAYGHGAVAVARAAVEAGATWLAVARLREGIQLRRAGLTAPILLLGPPTPAEVPLVVEFELRPTLVRADQARLFSDAARKLGREVPVHIKVDTGLGRYGATLEEARQLLHDLRHLPGLRIDGLYSHFAAADDPDEGYTAGQLEALRNAQADLEAEGFRFPIVHIAASAGALGHPRSHLGMVRVGISLYGLYPAGHLAPCARLRPALSFHARVMRVFRLRPGQSVGYGRTYVAGEPVVAALLPVGYADGLPRSHSNSGVVLVNGRRARLIGRVSMDQSVADVGRCGPVSVGDPVVLIGSQGEETITGEEFALRSGTINYEVVTSLGFRVPRVYVSRGAVAGVAYLGEGALEEWPA